MKPKREKIMKAQPSIKSRAFTSLCLQRPLSQFPRVNRYVFRLSRHRGGGKSRIFCLSLIFSLKPSTLDHSANVPPQTKGFVVNFLFTDQRRGGGGQTWHLLVFYLFSFSKAAHYTSRLMRPLSHSIKRYLDTKKRLWGKKETLRSFWCQIMSFKRCSTTTR